MKHAESILKRAALTAAAVLLMSVPVLAAEFTDAASIPHPEAVSVLAELGVINGRADGSFDPDGATNRAQMSKMVSILLEPAAGEVPSCGLTDVPGIWAEGYIDHCYSLGLISGYSDGTFRPGNAVTGTAAAKMLLSAAGFDGFTGEGWAQRVDEIAEGTGLYADFTADPSAPLTRDGSALLLYNALALLRSGTARFPGEPTGIAALPDGSLLVSDGFNRAVFQLKGRTLGLYAGEITEAADVNNRPLGGYFDGTAEKSAFKTPWAIAPFLDGWAVSDPENNVVRLMKDGRVQTINPSMEGRENRSFSYPTGLAAGPEGSLYVADTHNGRVCQVMPDGTMTVAAQGLKDPMGLCGQDGVLYIAETGGNRILRLADGRVSTVAGSGEAGLANGSAASARFSSPRAVAAGPDGSIYVSDTGNSAIRLIKGGKVTTLTVREPSAAEAGVPVSPVGLAVQGGRLYVCDAFAKAILTLIV